jgi:hypothetical protein
MRRQERSYSVRIHEPPGMEVQIKQSDNQNVRVIVGRQATRRRAIDRLQIMMWASFAVSALAALSLWW